MNQLNKKYALEASINLCVSIFLFVFLSLPLISSAAHAKKHTFLDEYNCHVCSIIEESPSDVIQSSSPFQVLSQETLISGGITLSILCFAATCSSNSDPPTNL